MEYEPVIGLEVHIQLETRTKLFCGCSTEFGASPNTHTCPVCLGLPGALPVPNRAAVDKALAAGIALNSEIPRFTKFDRKNYYYPDLPKNYQISQFDEPVCRGGYVEFKLDGEERRVRLVRAHLEEDAGKLNHDESGGHGDSLVDLNRTGTPLLEIVTEPDMHSPEEAGAFLATLKRIIEFQGISDCEMSEGSLRCDVNISLREKGSTALNTRTEIKNLNSFRNVERALKAEIHRQKRLYERGEPVRLATCLYDAEKNVTRVMRFKEEAHDYRYFPEPDLPPMEITPEWIAAIRSKMFESPQARLKRYREEYSLGDYEAEQLTMFRAWGDYFEEMVTAGASVKNAAHWFLNDIIKYSRNKELADLKVLPGEAGKLVKLVEDKKLRRNPGRLEILPLMMEAGLNINEAAKKAGIDLSGGAGADRETIRKHVREAAVANPKAAENYRSGKKDTTQWFIGQVMRPTRGQASVDIIREVIIEEMGEFPG